MAVRYHNYKGHFVTRSGFKLGPPEVRIICTHSARAHTHTHTHIHTHTQTCTLLKTKTHSHLFIPIKCTHKLFSSSGTEHEYVLRTFGFTILVETRLQSHVILYTSVDYCSTGIAIIYILVVFFSYAWEILPRPHQFKDQECWLKYHMLLLNSLIYVTCSMGGIHLYVLTYITKFLPACVCIYMFVLHICICQIAELHVYIYIYIYIYGCCLNDSVW